jgi:ribosome biogenesis protein ENP2
LLLIRRVRARRLSLETGRFLTPLPSDSPGLNVARVSPAHGLLAAGGEDGALECFDLRAPLATTRLANASANGGGVTCLRFDDSGMTVRPVAAAVRFLLLACLVFSDTTPLPRLAQKVAVGTHAGTVLLYDLRSSRPVLTKVRSTLLHTTCSRLPCLGWC